MAKGGFKGKPETDNADVTSSGTSGDDIILLESGASVDGGGGSDTYIANGYVITSGVSDSGGVSALDAGTSEWDVLEAGSKGTVMYFASFDDSTGIEEISAGGYNGVDIRGTAGDDVLDFSSTVLTGIEFINGLGGSDVIIGSQGNDTIVGNAGDDVLNGGGGSDMLVGGADADTFVFDDSNDGVDTVVDFRPGEDTIDVSNVTGEIDFEQRDADAVMTVDGADFAVFIGIEVDLLIA